MPKDKIGKRKGLGIALWAQYFLDNFKSVDEAIKAMQIYSGHCNNEDEY